MKILRFIEAIDRMSNQVNRQQATLQIEGLVANMLQPKIQKIILKTHELMTAVAIDQIVRCESMGGYTNFIIADGRQILVTKSLKSYEEFLPSQHFMRIHQSHLINLSYFESYLRKDEMIILKNNDEVPLASRKKEGVLQRIKEFCSYS